MSVRSSLRSATIIRWPVSFEVTLEIDPGRVADDETVGIVGIRLVKMGGRFVGWQPNMHRQPAIARFEFSDSTTRNEFVAQALEIPGVSVAAQSM